MTKTFQFDLVSPEKNLVSEEMAHVVIPALSGEMGIGADHEKYVVALKPGVVKLSKSAMNTVTEQIFIAGGFADVTGDSCTVLAEEAIPVNELDAKAIEENIVHLNVELDEADNDVRRASVRSKIDVAEAKLRGVAV